MVDHARRSDPKGREAGKPTRIPAGGWRDVLIRVKNQISKDTLSLVAAGVAFYAFLSVFPAITAGVSIYGMMADPAQAQQQVASLRGTVPDSALQIVRSQMTKVASSSGSTLGVGLVLGVGIALYSASKGMGALITSLNIAYDEEEKRGFIKLKLQTLGFTLVAVVFVLLMLGVIALPGLMSGLGLPGWLGVVIRAGRWVVMLGLMLGAVGLIYAFAPSRDRPRVRWASAGAIGATILWLIASVGFSFYVSNFGSYNETYGSAAAIVILMMWFWISAFVILLGAELNAELESQTRRDTTAGRPASPGRREAHAADTVAESP